MTTKEYRQNGLLSKDVVVMNFSGVYDLERMPHDGRFRWLDCRHLSGTDCYCDDEGKEALSKIISSCPAGGIHFIDSGNYHYVTKFWTDRIGEPLFWLCSTIIRICSHRCLKIYFPVAAG